MGRREEKAKATRKAILEAAARIVGRVGYAKASITRIAEEAGVSNGLIYQYFENQQDLFDQLLPATGEDMLRYISEQVGGAQSVADRERLGFEANFRYLKDHPEIHRVLNEAAFVAPETHAAYLRRMRRSYVRSLEQGHDAGEITAYAREEFEALAVMFIGAREYLLENYAAQDGKISDLPVQVQRTYLKAVAMAMGLDPKLVETPQ